MRCRAVSKGYQFPFLIGTVRTYSWQQSTKRLKGVSIPHRYGKNEELQKLIDKKVTFPFLIGTVRTEQINKLWEEGKLFPFLIGTVRTQDL